MLDQLAYFIDVIAKCPNWAAVNVGIPTFTPALGACLVKLMGGGDSKSLLEALGDTVRYGQFGWLAIAWTCSALFDGWDYVSKQQTGYSWMGWTIAIGIFATAVGTIVSVVCAERANRDVRHQVCACLTVVASILSAAALIHTHVQITS